MKQITPEIKANIFALYWGQDICYWPTSFESPIQRVIITDYTMRNAWLMVKPLSSITDEDAVEAAKHYHGVGADLPPERIRHVVRFINHICRCSRDAADYLRSKGYALPAFGYSIDELVEAGVFKLKEVNND